MDESERIELARVQIDLYVVKDALWPGVENIVKARAYLNQAMARLERLEGSREVDAQTADAGRVG